MYFERDFVDAHRQVLIDLLARSQRIAFWLFALTFAGYGLAFWIWYVGNPWTGLLIATLSYLFFRQFRTLSLGLARSAWRGDARAAPALRGLEQALEQGKPAAVMAELEAHLAALDGQDTQGSKVLHEQEIPDTNGVPEQETPAASGAPGQETPTSNGVPGQETSASKDAPRQGT